MHVKSSFGALLFAATCVASPAAAKVIDQSDIGFTVAHTAQVAEHSWSGDAANFWLDSQAGGCFCEKLPDEGQGVGSVQHARIIFAKPGEMMLLSGAFGPLQGEAVTGTLTIQIKKTPTGSAIRFDYVVGGYMRFKVADIAPAVDKVLAEQMVGLANALGGSLPVARGDKPAEDKSGEGADETAKPADSNADADGAAEPEPADSGLDAAVADLVKDEPKRD